MTPEQLSAAIVDVLATLSDEGALTLPDGVPSAVTIERPRQKEHGDYATNVALQLGKKAGLNPRDLAGQIQDRLLKLDGIEAVDVAGPGFLNISVSASAQGAIAEQVVAEGERYGTSDTGAGERVNVEFVSANPTGPVTLASARWAAVGDTISRLLEATGSEVAREYYFNDHGAQIDRFANSLLARGRGREVPEDGYQGSYIAEIAEAVLAEHPEVADQDDDEAQESFRANGVPVMFEEIKRTLGEFRVDFDIWFHENDLHESGAVQQAIDRLTELGNIYEKDGAKWLATEKFGDDKDRVIIRSTGQPAYLSGDLAYYLNKRNRGFDRCIILLGADHHGYVRRLMAMCAAFGDVPGKNLEIIIGQMVNLLSHGTVVRMGKRSGNIVTLLDLVEEIGVDAARYARWSATRSRPTSTSTSTSGPRRPATTRSSTSSTPTPGSARSSGTPRTSASRRSPTPSCSPTRRRATCCGRWRSSRGSPAAADLREPHRIARYLEDTAADYHRFYDNCRVLPMGDEEATDLNRARLLLVDATRVVLANGLALLGVTAPERM